MMLFKFMKRVFFISLFLISTANAADSITIENAWSPEAPPVAKVLAGYMKINNHTDKDIKINLEDSVYESIDSEFYEENTVPSGLKDGDQYEGKTYAAAFLSFFLPGRHSATSNHKYN